MKGQITLFVILGIIILAGGALFFSLRSDTAGIATRESLTASESVPIEFDPVKVFVEKCLEETAAQGLKMLGERGGFIEPYEQGLAPGDAATSGNSIELARNWLIPYWWHLATPDRCEGDCEFELVPQSRLHLYKKDGSPSIEGQLENYVDENIDNCIADFTMLEQQGYKMESAGSPRTDVVILDGVVQFALEYPIEASKISKKKISRFVSTINVDLMDIYNFGILLTSLEANYHFLERYLLDLIVGFSGLDREKLPPMTESTFNFGSMISWSKNRVHERMKEVLLSYVPLLRVYGTSNYEAFDFPSSYRTAFYNGDMTIPGNMSYSNLAIDFDYLGWTPYFDLNCDGDDCSPDSISTEIMSLFGFQRYYFLYDVSFPAMVTIRDPDALLFGGKGYSFSFLLEGNIRNNEPMETDYATIKTVSPSAGSMLCDESKRLSADVNIEAKDALTDEPISEAQIIYTCAGESCSIGQTGQNGHFRGRLPICINGILSFRKDDYISYSMILTTGADKEKDVKIGMNPILTKRFTVKKALMEKIYGKFNPVFETMEQSINLSGREHAMIILQRKSGLNEMPYTTYGELWGNQSYGEIRIAPGEYEMKIDVYYHGDFEIPERTETIEDQTVTYPSVEFNNTNPLPNGGLHCDSTHDVFKTSNPSFDENSDIVFNIISPNLQNTQDIMIEDLQEIGKLDEQAYTQYCYALSPKNE